MALGACADAQEDTVVQEAVEAGTAEALVGENLTVRGQVGEVLSDQAYIINGEYFGFDGAGTLVVGADAVDVTEGDFVEVAGTLTEFVIADIESFYDFDLDDDLLVSYEEQFAVVADSTEVVPAGAEEDDETVLEEAEEAGLAGAVVGDQVTVSAGIVEPLGPNAFTVGEDGTLVISAAETNVGPDGVANGHGYGARVRHRRPSRGELGIDLDDDLFADYEQELAIVADEVTYLPGVD